MDLCCLGMIVFSFAADDGALLAKLPKVKVLRNSAREGNILDIVLYYKILASNC